MSSDMAVNGGTDSAVLRVDGLCFRHSDITVFDNFSTCVPPGVTWVGGAEGTGKTCLLMLMGAAIAASAGHLHINGIALADDPSAYRSRVFWADPRSDAFDCVTPVAYWSAVQARYPLFDERLLADLVEGFSLAPHQDKALYMLSTGSKRKVWLAAAFASGAAVTLLDEPFAALDKSSISLLSELLQEAAEHPRRAWVVADYEAPRGVHLAATVQLDR
jgi:ABC-type multidrug transport system ATPase subunit